MVGTALEVPPDLFVLRQDVQHLIFGQSITRRRQIAEAATDQQRSVVRFQRKAVEQGIDHTFHTLAEQALLKRQVRSPAPRLFEG